MEWPMVYFDSAKLRAGMIEGFFTVPAFPPEDYDPKALASLYGPLPPLAQLDHGFPPAKSRGYLRAWDPIHQRLAWEVQTLSNWDGGVLSTGGGLVLQGDGAGYLNVYTADSGKQLAHVPLGTGVMAAPMTYRIAGTQYIAVVAGYGGDMVGYPLRANYAAYDHDNEGRIIVLQLDGGAVPLPSLLPEQVFPAPPAHEGTPTQIAAGEVLYNRFCARCHQLGRGELPDLRTLSAGIHLAFYDIVLNGALVANGMARWDDVLSRVDAESIHAYIVDESWKAYNAQTAASKTAASHQ
jgi:quinohemoprotein ethanol dehydrogenase